MKLSPSLKADYDAVTKACTEAIELGCTFPQYVKLSYHIIRYMTAKNTLHNAAIKLKRSEEAINAIEVDIRANDFAKKIPDHI